MANLIQFQPSKTYATEANVVKAVEKKFGGDANFKLTYFIQKHTDGRFFPVFIGERACHAGVHFHFNVVA